MSRCSQRVAAPSTHPDPKTIIPAATEVNGCERSPRNPLELRKLRDWRPDRPAHPLGWKLEVVLPATFAPMADRSSRQGHKSPDTNGLLSNLPTRRPSVPSPRRSGVNSPATPKAKRAAPGGRSAAKAKATPKSTAKAAGSSSRPAAKAPPASKAASGRRNPRPTSRSGPGTDPAAGRAAGSRPQGRPRPPRPDPEPDGPLGDEDVGIGDLVKAGADVAAEAASFGLKVGRWATGSLRNTVDRR